MRGGSTTKSAATFALEPKGSSGNLVRQIRLSIATDMHTMPIAGSRGKILRLKKYPVAHMNKQKLPQLKEEN